MVLPRLVSFLYTFEEATSSYASSYPKSAPSHLSIYLLDGA
jgi:hypothetical protein